MARIATQPAGGKAGTGSTLWLLGLACGAVVTLATPTALLVGLLLAPSAMVLAFDTRAGRPTLRPVVLSALAATIHPEMALWRHGHTLEAVFVILGDSAVLATAWAAQAGAWLLAEITPVLIRMVLDGQSFARAASLRAARRTYEELWGFPAIGDASAAEDPRR